MVAPFREGGVSAPHRNQSQRAPIGELGEPAAVKSTKMQRTCSRIFGGSEPPPYKGIAPILTNARSAYHRRRRYHAQSAYHARSAYHCTKCPPLTRKAGAPPKGSHCNAKLSRLPKSVHLLAHFGGSEPPPYEVGGTRYRIGYINTNAQSAPRPRLAVFAHLTFFLDCCIIIPYYL